MSRVLMLAPLLLAPLLLACAGCAVTDPLYREGLWHPTGANEANLRMMVAMPSNLVQGVAARGDDGHRAAHAVHRLRTDRVRELPNTGISKIAPVSAGAASAAPAAPGEGGE